MWLTENINCLLYSDSIHLAKCFQTPGVLVKHWDVQMKEREERWRTRREQITANLSCYFQAVTHSASRLDWRPALHSHVLEIHSDFNLLSSFCLHNVVINLNVQSSGISSRVLHNKVALVSVWIYGNSVS